MGKQSRRKRDVERARSGSSAGGRWWWITIAVVVVIGVVLVGVTATRHTTGVTAPDGTRAVEVGSAEHVAGEVDYAEEPPVGGDHNAVWQNCGTYTEPVPEENAVHSLEHGAVWITYRPDLGDGQVGELERQADGETHVLVSPRPDLPAPIVASAWGQQLELDDAGDPRLDEFVRAFQQGPQTPELGALCSGGNGTPA